MQFAPAIGHNSGWIEVICGSMFSGKSEELIRRVRRAEFAHQPWQVFKPALDNRYDDSAVVSHSEARVAGVPVAAASDILNLVKPDTQLVGIDEVQFFSDEIVKVVSELANRKVRVICAGLDLDFRGQPFGPMPQLLAMAEYVTKLAAVCMKCSGPAHRTQRLGSNTDLVVVGATDSYEARCRNCHTVPV